MVWEWIIAYTDLHQTIPDNDLVDRFQGLAGGLVRI